MPADNTQPPKQVVTPDAVKKYQELQDTLVNQKKIGHVPPTQTNIMGSDNYLKPGDYDYYYQQYEHQLNILGHRPYVSSGLKTISQLATHKMGYIPTFWQDPFRVSRMYAAIQAAPKGWTPPPWLNVDQVKAAYNWFKFRNGNTPVSEWKWLPADDPGNSFLAGMQNPPMAFLFPNDARYAQPSQVAEHLKTSPGFDWYSLPDNQRRSILTMPGYDIAQYPREIQDAMRADTNFDWTKLPEWQHTVFNIMSQPIAQGVASSLPMAAAGAVTGAVAGAAAGGAGALPGALIGGLIPLVMGAVTGAASGSKYEPLRKTAAGWMQVMMAPSQAMEQTISLLPQIVWGALNAMDQ
jgi:hypothetical protein